MRWVSGIGDGRRTAATGQHGSRFRLPSAQAGASETAQASFSTQPGGPRSARCTRQRHRATHQLFPLPASPHGWPARQTPPPGSAFTAIVQLLVRNGAAVHGRYGGQSLAWHAAAYGHPGTAEALGACGGGTAGDIARGQARYAQNVAEQRRQAAILLGAAVLFIAAASSDSGSGHSAARQRDEDMNGRWINMRQQAEYEHRANADAVEAGRRY